VYVALNIGSVLNKVCVFEIGLCGCKCREGALWGVYWKLVYMAVNVGSVHYSVCILEIGVCGFKYRECA